MVCAVCRLRSVDVGVLCDECRDAIAIPLGMVPEQIHATIGTPTDAALVDGWGRPHRLEAATVIGRTIERTGLVLVEGSVSRQHAHLTEGRDRDVWTLRDLGSANGTFVNDQPVDGAAAVRHGDRIRIGQVDLFFVLGAGGLPEVEVESSTLPTSRPRPVPAVLPATVDEETTLEQPLRDGDFADGPITGVGLPGLRLRLIEPTGGGGGLIDVEGVMVQLTPIQYELLSVLAHRMESESHQPPEVRGFVRGAELLGQLSWDTSEPSDNHLKQLVRRVRKILVREQIGDLVESRPRFGYRLRVVPHGS
jgi:pSer/pThr/pTyr-binding forkhead associated (FHA) protein